MPNAVVHNGKVYVLDYKASLNHWQKDALGEIPDIHFAVQDSPNSLRKIGIERESLTSYPEGVVEKLITDGQKRGLKDKSLTLGDVPVAMVTVPPGLTPEEVADLINNINPKAGDKSQKGEAYNNPKLAEELFNKAERGKFRESAQNAVEVIAISGVSPATAVFEMIRNNLNRSFSLVTRGEKTKGLYERDRERLRLLCKFDEAENKFEIWNSVGSGSVHTHVPDNEKIVISIYKDKEYPDRVRIRAGKNRIATELRSVLEEIAGTLLDEIIPREREHDRHYRRQVERLQGGGDISVEGEHLLKIARKLPEIREEGAKSTLIVKKVKTELGMAGLENKIDKINRPEGVIKSVEAKEIERLEKLAELRLMCESDPALRGIDPEELYKRLEGREVTPGLLRRRGEALLVYKRALVYLESDKPVSQDITLETMILRTESDNRDKENAKREESNYLVRRQFIDDLTIIKGSRPEFKDLRLSEFDRYYTEWAQMAERGELSHSLDSLAKYIKEQIAERERVEREVKVETTGDIINDMLKRSNAVERALERGKGPRTMSIDELLANTYGDGRS